MPTLHVWPEVRTITGIGQAAAPCLSYFFESNMRLDWAFVGEVWGLTHLLGLTSEAVMSWIDPVSGLVCVECRIHVLPQQFMHERFAM